MSADCAFVEDAQGVASVTRSRKSVDNVVPILTRRADAPVRETELESASCTHIACGSRTRCSWVDGMTKSVSRDRRDFHGDLLDASFT